ncbi:MAG TPA: DUF4468 domain-containing protein [Cytophagaceae bacterium]|nr:DUF4468 domain-containing protein [Cytophagaceae bacterium]
MKKLFTCSLILFAFLAKAQTKTFPIDSASKKIMYSEVIQLNGVTKDELYKRAKNLGVAGNGTQKDDPAQGLYMYKGFLNVSYPAPQPGLQHSGKVEYLVTLACKDGRYKYIITNFVHSGEKASGGKLEGSLPECGKLILTLAAWGSIKKQTMEQMDKFIKNLKANMEGADPNAPKVGNDW